MDSEIIFECRKISKHFGLTHALKDVSLVFRRGHIHGLIGENGSGKSTLTSIISGIYPATGGEMYYKGERWCPSSSLYAREHGIRFVVQEAGTIRNISVAENIFMGQEDKFRRGFFVSRAAMNREAKKALENIGVTDILPEILTRNLDIELRKLVEIARSAYGKPEIFIIDETTTALSQSGREILYKLMHRLTKEDAAVIFISHDFDELLEHCDCMTVLRDGQMAGTVERKDFDGPKIKQMMIGRQMDGNYYRTDFLPYEEEVVLRAEEITTLHDLMNFSFELHKGEILGIGGLSECGMHTLGKAVFGFEPLVSGKVFLPQKKKDIHSSEDAVRHGLAYVSKDRDVESLALNAPVRENIASTGYKVNRGFGSAISSKKEKAYVKAQIESLSIKCSSMDAELNSMSGGNKQKVVFGKWVAKDSDILILDCPTRGVDIGVKAAMYELMNSMKRAGKSILMISEELPELIGMSDRILILKDGIISKEVRREDVPRESELIEYMI